MKSFSVNPYKWIVKSKIIRGFKDLSNGDYAYVLSLMSNDVVYEFEGDHALGGTRVSKTGVEKWFKRLIKLLPGKFELHGIYISGPIWNTKAVVEFTDTVTPQYGDTYQNNGVQVASLKFGKVKKVHTYVNTNKVISALNTLYKNGIIEANTTKIEE